MLQYEHNSLHHIQDFSQSCPDQIHLTFSSHLAVRVTLTTKLSAVHVTTLCSANGTRLLTQSLLNTSPQVHMNTVFPCHCSVTHCQCHYCILKVTWWTKNIISFWFHATRQLSQTFLRQGKICFFLSLRVWKLCHVRGIIQEEEQTWTQKWLFFSQDADIPRQKTEFIVK